MGLYTGSVKLSKVNSYNNIILDQPETKAEWNICTDIIRPGSLRIITWILNQGKTKVKLAAESTSISIITNRPNNQQSITQ